MIRFRDVAGDSVEGGEVKEEYALTCFARDAERGIEMIVGSLLDRSMARALATDLLAFADSDETATETETT